MIRKNAPPPRFPIGAPVLVTPTRMAALSVCRLTVDVSHGAQVDVTMPAEDAFVVLYQLRDHPPHELRLDGKLHDVGPSARATLNIIDMAGEPRGRLRQSVDTLFFHLPRAALDEIAEEAGAAKIGQLIAPEAWATKDSIIDSLQGLVVDALADGAPANRLLHDHLLCGLGAHFAATYGGMQPHRLKRGGLAPWQERRAEELLADNLSGDLSLYDIARECGLSAAYFSRAFKRSSGTTPHGWLQQRRIETAKHLLAERALPLAEIALRCGFADQSHFTRTFARLTGVTPGTWQRLQ
jgi:AraC family transcriptional regulator